MRARRRRALRHRLRPMLEQLRVRHFRGFEDLEVDRLRRINLIAGRNDTGKSTLLEAIFLLGSAANPQQAVNSHVVRSRGVEITGREAMAETFWLPLFFTPNTDSAIAISGRHSVLGELKLKISLDKYVTTEVLRDRAGGAPVKAGADERLLTFTYTDPQAGTHTGRARETAETVLFDRTGDDYTAFMAGMLKPGRGDIKQDAVNLGRLRKRKSGDLVLEALQVVDSRLQGIEDNASSGAPMIRVDVGLPRAVAAPGHGTGPDARRSADAGCHGRTGRRAAGGRGRERVAPRGAAGHLARRPDGRRAVQRAGLRDDPQLRVPAGRRTTPWGPTASACTGWRSSTGPRGASPTTTSRPRGCPPVPDRAVAGSAIRARPKESVVSSAQRSSV